MDVKTCNISEVLWVTLPSHLLTLIVILTGSLNSKLCHTCSPGCTPSHCKLVTKKWIIIFIKEFIIIIVPLILMVTIFSELALVVVIMFLCVLITLICIKTFKPYKLKRDIINFYDTVNSLFKMTINDDKRSFATCCRSIVNTMTIISILAVDFNIFPRKFHKTETYGVSLMDIGVGFFIFSNAGVVKSEKIINESINKTILGSSVLFGLGILRYFATQFFNYNTNITEYGVHWNFFFTLGAVKILTCVILKTVNRAFWPGIVLSILHQSLLYLGLEDYVIGNQERNNWIDANREGLVSSLGYNSLFLIGMSMKTLIIKRSTTIGGDLKIALTILCISSGLFVGTAVLSGPFPVSRRIANLTYISWVTASGLLHIMVAMIVEIFVTCFILSKKCKCLYNFLTPIIFDSVNENGLIFFLIGNLLTGIVNILLNTSRMGSLSSLLILIFYMLINCVIVTYMYFKKIKIKFW